MKEKAEELPAGSSQTEDKVRKGLCLFAKRREKYIFHFISRLSILDGIHYIITNP